MAYRHDGRLFTDDGIMHTVARPSQGILPNAARSHGWATDSDGRSYIEPVIKVPQNAVRFDGQAFTQDGALYVTSAAFATTDYKHKGLRYREDGALYIEQAATLSAGEQKEQGWRRTNSGRALVTGPSFSLQFPDLGDGTVNLIPSSGNAAATFTRATTATTVLSNGLIGSVASGAARSYYDPTSLAYLGYLAEGARTNLLLQSADFTSVSWSKTDATPTLSGTGPDGGTNTANLITEGSAGTATVNQGVTATADVNYAVSAFLKRGNTDWIRFQFANGANAVRGWFNLALGTAGAPAVAGTGAAVGATIKAHPNGWYRVTLVGSVGSGATAISPAFVSADADQSLTRVNNATYSVWGAQFENNVSFASSYIPTTVATVTRNADVLTYPAITGANAVGTMYAEVMSFWATSGTVSNIVSFANSNNTYPLGIPAGTAATTMSIIDGTTQAQKAGLTDMSTAKRKRASAWDSGGMAVTGDGAAVATAAFDGDIGSTAFAVGCRPDGVQSWFGTISRIDYFPTRMDNSALASITT